MEDIKLLELFGGIGACTKAFDRLGLKYKVVDYVEIDKYAVQSYNALHGTTFEPQDITQWNKNIDVNFIMHGSPCQDFSLIGKQAGGDENSGTRSSLMYETIRIVSKLTPKYVVWENVKNVLSNKHIHNFEKYCDRMQNLGYTNYYKVLNAKDYGIPQNRARLFVVSIRNDVNKAFEFQPEDKLYRQLRHFLEENVKEKYYLQDGTDNRFFVQAYDTLREKPCQTFDVINAFNKTVSKTGICPTITTRPEGFKTAILIVDGKRVRKITPRECWRLMGFDDSDFDKVCKIHSDAKLYHQAGNSIVVNVLESIISSLFL